MKITSVYSAAVGSLALLFEFSSASKVVEYVVKRAELDSYSSKLTRRTAPFTDELLWGNDTVPAYYATAYIGTPGQEVHLLISTGSSDVWVIEASAEECSIADCVTPFNSSKSQNPQFVSNDFNITYADGRNVTGLYFVDNFGLGPHGEEYMILQMGLGLNISERVATTGGVMGIGYASNEATLSRYPSLIEEMYKNGLINTMLYSLWLNDLQSGVGSLLFGGIDTEKYYGTLYSSPVLPDPYGNITSFNVSLTSVSIQSGKGDVVHLTDDSFLTGVVLEAGTTYSYLPDHLVSAIYVDFEVVFASDGGAYIDCKYSNSSTMTFGFASGSSIEVAYSDLVFAFKGTAPSDVNFPDICMFGIYSSAGDSNGNFDINTLGEPFLRSAYVVYDMQNNMIGLAQAVPNATASNVVEVAAGAKAIPRATGVSLPNATPTPSRAPGPTTPISTPTPTITPIPAKKNVVPIAVGVAVPVAAILAGLLAFFIWHRRRKSPEEEHSGLPPPIFVHQSYDGVVRALDKKTPPPPTGTEHNYHPYQEDPISELAQPQMRQNNFISELPTGTHTMDTSLGSPNMSTTLVDGAYPQSNRGSLPVYSPYHPPEDRAMSPALSEVAADPVPGSPMSSMTAETMHNNMGLH